MGQGARAHTVHTPVIRSRTRRSRPFTPSPPTPKPSTFAGVEIDQKSRFQTWRPAHQQECNGESIFYSPLKSVRSGTIVCPTRKKVLRLREEARGGHRHVCWSGVAAGDGRRGGSRPPVVNEEQPPFFFFMREGVHPS